MAEPSGGSDAIFCYADRSAATAVPADGRNDAGADPVSASVSASRSVSTSTALRRDDEYGCAEDQPPQDSSSEAEVSS